MVMIALSFQAPKKKRWFAESSIVLYRCSKEIAFRRAIGGPRHFWLK